MNCIQCGKELEADRRINAKFCDTFCRVKWNRYLKKHPELKEKEIKPKEIDHSEVFLPEEKPKEASIEEISEAEVDIYKRMQTSPIFFVERMWGMTPERDNEKFIKGKHITRQQHDMLLAIEKALQGKAPKRISIKAGHGVGKSCTLSWLILWYLFCYKDAQVPCTAPSSDQMHDILWKEVAKWMKLMPVPVQAVYDWSNGYIRVLESPNTWFARAKTARKETPEALAGVHGDFVMYIIDEAPGVPDEIFNTAEGALTGKNVLVIMIGNPTRLVGYFYDSFRSDQKAWQHLTFHAEQSPIVDQEFVDRIVEKHGLDSDEYRIRVAGEFPREDTMDESGYVQMFLESDIKYSPPGKPLLGELNMGIDPAGEGRDETIWVIRDNFQGKLVAKESISNAKSIAQKTLTLMDLYGVKSGNIYVDNFGEGANVAQELAMSGHRVSGVNVGDRAFDDKMFLNLRAEAYWKLKKFIREGGELSKDEEWKELTYIRYRKELNGKMKVMGKVEMKKNLGKSPDAADALMLTFIAPPRSLEKKRKQILKNKLNKTKTYSMKMA